MQLKKMVQIGFDTHTELMKLKAELHHKNISETIDYLLYELNKEGDDNGNC